MGLTIIAYVIGLVTLVMGSYLRDRIGQNGVGRFVFLSLFGFGFLSLLSALTVNLNGWNGKAIPLFTFRASYVCLIIGTMFFLQFALSYPYDTRARLRQAISWIAVVVLGWTVFFKDWFISGLSNDGGKMVMAKGDYYFFYAYGAWALALIASLTLFIRGLFNKSRIYRLQQSIMALIGLVVCAMGSFFYVASLDIQPILFPLVCLSGFLLMLGLYWATSISKLFNVAELLGRSLAALIFSVVIAVPAGLGAAFALRYGEVSPLIPAFGLPLCFFLGSYLFTPFATAFFRVFSRQSNYLGALERGLADIDFSQGRGIVFDRLSAVLCSNMGFTDLSILIEDSDGNLQVAYSTSQAKLTVEHKTSPFDFVVNMKADILLKTEAIANYNFHRVKPQLLAIFDALKAEAIIILREGNHIIGLISLGQKTNGSDYTTYDQTILNMLYGKIFAIGFYLKNIAKESILTTVDRELQYSNQIIASVQGNIDAIDHPKADLAFLSKSTRKLGGDFLDFVKLSKDRWFFILGDVSGKGLNASMSMIILKSTIRTFLKEEKDFSRLVIKANEFIKLNLPRGTFFAGVFGILDFSKDTIFFVNAGVPAMFMYSPQFNNVMEVQGDGRVLGFVRDYSPHLRLRKLSLQPGSILFMSTDGIIEAESMRAERYGKERVQRCVSEFRGYNAESMVQQTMASLQTFVAGEVNDDVTLLALKYQG